MARVKARVIGLGERRKGVSTKTNRPYDFQEIVFAFEDSRFKGLNAFTAPVNGTDLDAVPNFGEGVFVDLVYHSHAGRCYVDAIIG